MFILKILGILDLLVASCYWIFGIFHVLPGTFILVLGFYLLLKGIVFAAMSLNIVSIIDVIVALLIMASVSIVMPKVIVIILSLYLVQKGIFSMIG